MKILLVDDNEDNLILMKNALQRNEHTISLATSGAQALDIVEKEAPDLILLDIMMPEMDGFATCKKIHFSEKGKGTPIIMVTAKNDMKDLTRGFECGAIDYIKKPFHNVELIARVKSALRLKEATDELIKERQKATVMEMAAAVAHNLNQPLSGIVLNIQYIQTLLDENPELNPELGDKLEILVSLVDTMSEMIKKIGRITSYYTMQYIKDIKIIDIDTSSEN